MGLEEQEGKGERGEHTRRAKVDPAFLCSLPWVTENSLGHMETKHSASLSLFWVKELTALLSSSQGMCQVADT